MLTSKLVWGKLIWAYLEMVDELDNLLFQPVNISAAEILSSYNSRSNDPFGTPSSFYSFPFLCTDAALQMKLERKDALVVASSCL